MILWRITGRRHAATRRAAFSGEGGRGLPGRWHQGGLPVVYTASSFSLAQLETLVHTTNPTVLPRLVLVRADLPGTVVSEEIDVRSLPKDWRDHPAPLVLQKTGQDWLSRGSSVALLVPSALSPEERNVLLNPQHRDFARVRLIEPPVLRSRSRSRSRLLPLYDAAGPSLKRV